MSGVVSDTLLTQMSYPLSLVGDGVIRPCIFTNRIRYGCISSLQDCLSTSYVLNFREIYQDKCISDPGNDLYKAAYLRSLTDRSTPTAESLNTKIISRDELDTVPEKTPFSCLSLNDPFFDTLKADYVQFERWFTKKAQAPVFITRKPDGRGLQSFCYLKIEENAQDFSLIKPAFSVSRRLKIGTLKVDGKVTGLGDFYLKLAKQCAVKERLDEIYLTIFENSDAKSRLLSLIQKHGFVYWGHKGGEAVYLCKIPKVKHAGFVIN